MLNVLLVIHLLACIALVVLVMLQRSEGGALGMGGGGSGSGLISGRGVANVLSRATMILAAVFFVTSLTLTRLNTEEARAPSGVQRELEKREGDMFDPLAAPGAPAPAGAPASAAPPASAPADPLAPAAPAATQAVPAAPGPAPAATPGPTEPAVPTVPQQNGG
jgi:preprotein translocase subunit SecG